jgi:hypothetical protein
MSSLLVLNGVYRLEIQSVMLVISTGFVNYCPSNLLSGQCVRGGSMGMGVIGGEGAFDR